jgi:GxxExxY protein
MDAMEYNELSYIIWNCALKIHKVLGPGLLENAYEECLFYELTKAGLLIEKQKSLPLVYEEIKLESGYRIDLIVENKIILELKAVEVLNPVHEAQILTYLKLSGCKLGFLVNFNVKYLKTGFKRYVNNY